MKPAQAADKQRSGRKTSATPIPAASASLWRTRRLILALFVLAGLVAWAGFHLALNAWAKSHLRSARRALAQRNFVQAEADLEVCLKHWPDDADLHFQRARSLRRAALVGGDDANWESKALQELSECDRLNYPPEDVALERSLVMAMHGDLERVETRLLALLSEEQPDSPLILETLAPLYLARFQVPRALLCIAQLIAHEPDNAYAHYWRGLARDLLLSHGQAIDEYQRALDLNPNFKEARQHLAEALLTVQHYAEARQQFEWLLERTPGDRALLLGLARAWHGQGDLERTQSLLDQLAAGEAEESLVLEERGKLAFEQGQLEDAERFLSRALQLAPGQAQANYTLYQCLLHQGRKAEAEKYRTRFEQIKADTQRFRKLAELIRTSPQKADLRAEAGTLLLRNDQAAQALGWLTSALQLDPYHPTAHRALGDYYDRLGQRDRAEFHRRRAAEGTLRRLRQLYLPLL
jgi:tetratricopeptide (TPR) repeat protein